MNGVKTSGGFGMNNILYYSEELKLIKDPICLVRVIPKTDGHSGISQSKSDEKNPFNLN